MITDSNLNKTIKFENKLFFVGISLGSNSTNETGVAILDRALKIITLDKLFSMEDVRFFLKRLVGKQNAIINIALPENPQMLNAKWKLISREYQLIQSSELINQTSMGADGDGRPYIATYWKEQGDSIPQYRLVWLDTEGEWRHCLVSDRVTPFSLSGGGTKMIPMARPRVLVDGRKAYFLFRDVERGSRVSMASTDDIESGEWQVSDLTDFSVDAWEPSIDTELWNFKRKINIYVQAAHQGDGEKTVDSEPTDVYILEL